MSRVTYLDAAILDLNRTPLPQCEGIDGFDCSDPAIVFNVDARQYFCGPHHRFWEKHYQSHDTYEFGQLAAPQTCKACGHSTERHEEEMPYACYDCGCEAFSHIEPQTLVEWVCEYMDNYFRKEESICN